MLIKNIKIKNFRNIENAELSFDEKMNVISGENAQGKTNIIEALWLFCGAKSFRGAKDGEFLRFGQNKGYIEIIFISGGTEHNARIEVSDKKTCYLDSNSIKTSGEYAGVLREVVFSPSDIALIDGGPDKRRRFLDISIGQLYPGYISFLKEYNRSVLQRNRIIKEFKYDPSVSILLDSFEEKIAASGEKIIDYRKKFLEKINSHLPDIFWGLSGEKEKIKSLYVANEESSMLLERLKYLRKEDSLLGFTSVGPHRDDIEFFINGVSAKNYGSQGQKRSVAISLKLASLNVIYELSGEYPVCLLDDVMSELDEKRQKYILNHVREWQTFITCCDPSNVERLSGGIIFNVKNGGVV